MSVGDVRGARRRFRIRQINGWAPTPKGRSVSEIVAREREYAKRAAKVAAGKKKGG
jgi:hypothetical protein